MTVPTKAVSAADIENLKHLIDNVREAIRAEHQAKEELDAADQKWRAARSKTTEAENALADWTSKQTRGQPNPYTEFRRNLSGKMSSVAIMSDTPPARPNR
jgi:SMC interacting uncharacterized protein involved in chromosome segregation